MVNGVRFEDCLEGASNFVSWKFRIMIALRDNELDEFVKKVVPELDDKGEDHLIIKCKQELASEFDMKDLGLLHYFLSLEVWQKPDGIILSQGKYIIEILKRFGMMNCKSMVTPMETNLHKLREDAAYSKLADPTLYRQLIGSLMYLVNTRSYICYAVSALSQFMSEPRLIHLVVAKHILRYLRGTIGYGLKYDNVDLNLHWYIDSDWAGSVTNRKSTSGCCFSLGSAMTPGSVGSNLQLHSTP
ncbi:uncharacterized mitochondrial protein AtMg00810-like [Cryptomeria japonica]|uniref:uncharacterized mitochondrial protein AtMg00810-like n=1 Tax=Cryptomeria japonica TaxID=3369 RepID=UPI0027DA4DF0|nr:uncharacterized mitochondrial protein AtMg00810-like [Cryptomeria japonica]